MNAGDLIKQLQGVRSVRGGWIAKCPAHDDRTASFSISEQGGKVLLFCHAGCTLKEICAALGIAERDLFNGNAGRSTAKNETPRRIVAEYNYVDEQGNVLWQNVRLEPKDFRQRRPGGKGDWVWNLQGVRRVLYRLPEVLAAKDLLFVEGEKDADTAAALGFTATTSGSARSWRPEFGAVLQSKRITIIADADDAGRRYVQQVAASIFGKAESVKVLEFANAKDLTEWVERGGTRDALLELIRNVPEWRPAAEPSPQQAGAVLRCFSDISPKPLHWLWPGRIPLGKLTLLIGDPGLGRSSRFFQRQVVCFEG